MSGVIPESLHVGAAPLLYLTHSFVPSSSGLDENQETDRFTLVHRNEAEMSESLGSAKNLEIYPMLYNLRGTDSFGSYHSEYSENPTRGSSETSDGLYLMANYLVKKQSNVEQVCPGDTCMAFNPAESLYELCQKDSASLPLLCGEEKPELSAETLTKPTTMNTEENVQWVPYFTVTDSLKAHSPESTSSSSSSLLFVPQSCKVPCDRYAEDSFQNLASVVPIQNQWSSNFKQGNPASDVYPKLPNLVQPKKRRGRPKGSRNKTIRTNFSTKGPSFHSTTCYSLNSNPPPTTSTSSSSSSINPLPITTPPTHDFVKPPMRKKKKTDKAEYFFKNIDFNNTTKEPLDANNVSKFYYGLTENVLGKPISSTSILAVSDQCSDSHYSSNGEIHSLPKETFQNSQPKKSLVFFHNNQKLADFINPSLNDHELQTASSVYSSPVNSPQEHLNANTSMFPWFIRCVICGESGKTKDNAYVCSNSFCSRSFCVSCVAWEKNETKMKLFNEELNECVVCTYQSRKRANVDPNTWHFTFKDISDGYFIRTLRDILPHADGLFIEVSRTRQPCWRRKLSNKARKHFSFRFYGGVFESRLEALEIGRYSKSAHLSPPLSHLPTLMLKPVSCKALYSNDFPKSRHHHLLPQVSWTDPSNVTPYDSHCTLPLNECCPQEPLGINDAAKEVTCFSQHYLKLSEPSRFSNMDTPCDSRRDTLPGDMGDNEEGCLDLLFSSENHIQEPSYALGGVNTVGQYPLDATQQEKSQPKSNDSNDYLPCYLGISPQFPLEMF